MWCRAYVVQEKPTSILQDVKRLRLLIGLSQPDATKKYKYWRIHDLFWATSQQCGHFDCTSHQDRRATTLPHSSRYLATWLQPRVKKYMSRNTNTRTEIRLQAHDRRVEFCVSRKNDRLSAHVHKCTSAQECTTQLQETWASYLLFLITTAPDVMGLISISRPMLSTFSGSREYKLP